MPSLLASPTVRWLAAGAAAVILVGLAYGQGRSDGRGLCEAEQVRSDTDARNKADDARGRAEREFDRGGVQPDRWQRD